MPRTRKQQISQDATSFYHCVYRCVRHAFLCGKDTVTGRSYEHRRHLIECDLLRLASIFYIDLLSFCGMSNHHRDVVHVDREQCRKADPREIALEWHQLFKAKVISQKFIEGKTLARHEQYQLDTLIDARRSRLHDISWFMKVLNEKIARIANSSNWTPISKKFSDSKISDHLNYLV